MANEELPLSTLLREHAFRFDIGWASLDETKSVIEIYGGNTKRHIENDCWAAKFMQALHGFYR